MKELYKGEQLYMIGVSTLKRLGIRFIPYKATLTSTPNMQEVYVVGRNVPDYSAPSGSDTLALTLDFIAEERMMNDVRDKCNWLRSLRYSAGPNEPQERVKLIWGALYNQEVWVVKNVVINYEHFMRGFGALPKRAQVDIVLALDGIGTTGTNRSKNIYRDDIQNLGGTPGIDASLGTDTNTRLA